ncbi:Molybdopterin molybdenumtransferase [Emticicia aquatica]|uniref:Molybdopterin molybdenumtransferase n=1 Tax=Emticicia aquatica TaxID=1681835 RepID=A0ABN8EUG7_9BACT|nr:molybdopterin molybdotransferase MoeA [Emticicia aquatica]CAH0996704.1 Molybdopterin molybdenumtransferase [Emticicia aquatica]
MITVEEAERIILENTINIPTEKVSIDIALGRVLAEDLCADRDFPPFNRVTMDGIAIQFAQLKAGKTIFEIETTAAAGNPQKTLNSPQNCVEVMTGAMIPLNTDMVIRYEDLLISGKKAQIIADFSEFKEGQNIHLQGSDRRTGEVIVSKGRKISSAEIGVAATIGKHEILVQKKLRAVVISTGEEIVPIKEKPLPHQIRTSNSYALQASLKNWGLETENILLPDNQDIIEQKITEFTETFDVLILSGGVSAGKFDFVPQALENQGVKKLFHKVSQRPGKPFWFGKTRNGTLVFALPGNPVSTFMCLNRFFKKWIDASQGIDNQQLMAELAQDFSFKPELTFFLQVKLSYTQTGKILATPVEGHGSGDLANLVEADAFLELPLGNDLFKKGEVFKAFVYR